MATNKTPLYREYTSHTRRLFVGQPKAADVQLQPTRKTQRISVDGSFALSVTNVLKQVPIRQFKIKKVLPNARSLKLVASMLAEREDEVNELRKAVGHLSAQLNEQHEMLRVLIKQQSISTPSVASSSSVSTDDASAEQEWQELVSAGESVRLSWVQEGLLIPSHDLASAWARTPQALSQASSRGELLSLKVKRNRYYPAVFKSLSADDVKEICQRLKGNDEAGHFIFWNKAHSSLGGLTPEEAIHAGNRDKVAQLADAWSAERGYKP